MGEVKNEPAAESEHQLLQGLVLRDDAGCEEPVGVRGVGLARLLGLVGFAGRSCRGDARGAGAGPRTPERRRDAVGRGFRRSLTRNKGA